MSPSSQIDLNGITEQLLRIIKTCADSNNINETLQALLKQERSKEIKDGEEFKGLRAQILANAELLLPILVPESIGESRIDGRTQRTIPPMQVITAQTESSTGQAEIYASVTFGELNTNRKTALMFTSEGYPTVTEAFRELLAVSGRLIAKHFTTARNYDFGGLENIEGGGFFTTLDLAGDVRGSYDKQHNRRYNNARANGSAIDLGDSPAANSAKGPTKTGYKKKLTAARKAHALSKEPNASFSFPSVDQDSLSTTSTVEDEDDSPILSAFPANSHKLANNISSSKVDDYIRPRSHNSSVSSIAANPPGCDRKVANSTYKKMRYFEKYDYVCKNIAKEREFARSFLSRSPSEPEYRSEYIDDFLSPEANGFTIEHSSPPRSYVDPFLSQSELEAGIGRDDRFDDYNKW